jgi:hypothetical protein
MPSAHKTTGTISWDVEECFTVGFLLHRETINAVVAFRYSRSFVMHCVTKCPGNKKINLQHDNAQKHTAHLCGQYSKNGWELLPHPPYHVGLSPLAYYLGSKTIRCKVTIMQPMRQSRKPSTVLYEQLKQRSTTRESPDFRMVAKIH